MNQKLDFLKKPDDAAHHKLPSYPVSVRGDRHHPAKRLRDSAGDISSSEAAKRVDNVKEVTALKLEIMKLKEEKSKKKIEEEFSKEEKKDEKLREEEAERNKHDSALSQRNTLYERNIQLDQELSETNDNFLTYQRNNEELINKLQREVIKLEKEQCDMGVELEKSKRMNHQHISKMEWENQNKIDALEFNVKVLKNTEKRQTEEIELLQLDIAKTESDKTTLNKLRSSERELRMKLDSLKNKEILATIFPNKVLKSKQLEEEHSRLVRDYNNLKDSKENTDLLKIKLEDARKEISSLKHDLTDYHKCKNENESLNTELESWQKAKKDLNLSSPSSLLKNIGHYQKENVVLTANIEKYKATNTDLTEERDTLQHKYKECTDRLGEDGNSLTKLHKKLSNTEHMLASVKEECDGYKRLLDSYNTAPPNEKPNMKRPCTKILHMTHNPVQEQISQEVKRLKTENSHLKSKLESSENSSVFEELEQCQVKLRDSESSNKKTKTIFRQRVNEFREGCCELFGFTITQPADKQFVLLSNYAESKTNTILFNSGPNNAMELMENEFSKTMDIQTHIFKLKQHRSIPLFLADLTSDLFHRQTTVLVGVVSCD